MALAPTFDVSLKTTGTNFYFTDTTGVYNVDSNVGGYGTPNDEGADITSAIIRITDPSGETYDYDVTNQIPDSVTGDVDFTAFNGDWADGLYTFEYIVTGTQTTNTSIKRIFTPKVDCCVDKLLAKFVENFTCDDCYEDYQDVVQLMYLRDALHIAGLMKNQTQITNTLTLLNGICELC